MNDDLIPAELPPDAEGLLSTGGSLRDRSYRQRAATWRAVEARALGGETRWVAASGSFALTCAVLAVVFLRTQSMHFLPLPQLASDWREIDIAGVARITLAPGAHARFPVSGPAQGETYRVTLDEGQLCAEVVHRDLTVQGAFVVEADGLQVISIGTHFCVFAGDGPSWVAVEEGRVRVEGTGSAAAFVAGGGSLRADDAQLVAIATPRALPPSFPEVVRQAPNAPLVLGTARHTKSSLADQNRLYQTGLSLVRASKPLEALAVWDEYGNRYQRGVFAAEVERRRVLALTEGGRFAEALIAASQFQDKHADDWRSEEIALTRADLLRERFDRPADALAIYDRLRAGASQPMLRERALYGSYLSLVALSRTSDARARARDYLQLFPSGEHSDELARSLAGE